MGHHFVQSSSRIADKVRPITVRSNPHYITLGITSEASAKFGNYRGSDAVIIVSAYAETESRLFIFMSATVIMRHSISLDCGETRFRLRFGVRLYGMTIFFFVVMFR